MHICALCWFFSTTFNNAGYGQIQRLEVSGAVRDIYMTLVG
jgi:hypothetical protein